MSLERICAWCKKVLSPGNNEDGGSHTICENCQKQVEEEIRQYVNKQQNPQANSTNSTNSTNWYKLAAPPMPLNEFPEETGGKNVDNRLTEEDVQYIETKYPLKHKLGEGYIGVAYSTQDGKVLKITPSKEEYDLANIVKQQSYFAPVVKIHETEYLPNSNVYLILRDKVKQLNDMQQSVVDNCNEFQTIIDKAEKQTEKEFTQITPDDIEQHFTPNGIETTDLLNSINWSGFFNRTTTSQQVWDAISHLQSLKHIIDKAREFWNGIAYFSATDIRGENCGWDKDGDIVAFDFGITIEANNTFNLKRFSQTNQSKKPKKGLSKYEIELLKRINGYYDEDKYSDSYDDDGKYYGNDLARDDIYHMYTDSDDGGSELEPLLWWHDGVYLHVADEYGGTHSSNFGGYDWRYFYHGRYSKKINLITSVVPQHIWKSNASQTLNEKAWIRRDEKAIDVITDLRDYFGHGPDIVAII